MNPKVTRIVAGILALVMNTAIFMRQKSFVTRVIT